MSGFGTVAVAGAGAWGTALAAVTAGKGAPTVLLARCAAQAEMIERDRENARYLPGARLPDALRATADPASLRAADAVLVATPAQSTRAMLIEMAPMLAPGAPLILCAKGVERGARKLLSEVAAEAAPRHPVAILTGPSFADDVVRGKPTAVTLACADAELGARLQTLMASPTFRPYLSEDVVGAQMGGAVKNVLAIACGVAVGRGLGESARAALMTRGFAEMIRLAQVMGGRIDTLHGLSGLGDLALTCASPQSRNFAFGAALGEGAPLDELADSGKVVEGARTAEAALDLARAMKIDAPITEAVAAIVSGRTSLTEAIESLLNRPLKRET